MDIQKFDDFISRFPVYEYRLINTADISVEERVRIICKQECERYGSTWACPPAVGSLSQCEEKIRSFPQGIFFSSVAEVSDLFNMEEMLSTRRAHEQITTEIHDFIKGEGHKIYILSTESCDLCDTCAYLQGKPCRYPDKMHPCLESHGIVANAIVEEQQMEYNLGGNTILWFSLILFH